MKLTKEDIKKLPSGASQHHVRLTRLHYPEIHNVVVFDGVTDVFIARREKAYKKLPVGQIITITAGTNWAEAGESEIEQNGSIIVEDYLMEIFSEK